MDVKAISELPELKYLLSAQAVRAAAERMFIHAQAGHTHFRLHLEKLDSTCDYVIGVIREHYPDLKIPFHSRKVHLNAGGFQRTDKLRKALLQQNPQISELEIAKTQIELVVVSVLLDAGAGARWYYFDEVHQREYSRSEGLAVASFEMFMKGGFSSDPQNPLQVDQARLQQITEKQLEHYFQVTELNPMQGLKGRTLLLNQLGQHMSRHPEIYTRQRLGDSLDQFLQARDQVLATEVLQFVLKYWGEIWPERIRLFGVDLGDTWIYPPFKGQEPLAEYVPFHKLSQWLTYSLLVPMMEAGIRVQAVEQLTGLPEYRNGGLLLDLGILEFRNSSDALKKYRADSELIIEWRALTVALLDRIGEGVRKKLGLTEEEFPLAKVLEGGTWAAGRKIAKSLREGGVPPLNIESDGTVF